MLKFLLSLSINFLRKKKATYKMFPLPGKLYTLSSDRINENVSVSFKLHIEWLTASQCNIKYNKSVLLNKTMSFVGK